MPYPTAPVSCTACSGGPQPGAVALSEAVRRTFPWIGTMGIYNCRSVRGGSSLSIHACGRAWDAATSDHDRGWDLARLLVANARNLGIQRIIWWRQIWTAATGWRAYGGAHPHTDHLHIELRPESATGPRALTVEYVMQVIGGQPGQPPQQDPNWRPLLRRGDKGPYVRELQELLNKHGSNIKVDGDFGPITESTVRSFQAKFGLVEDGIVGKQTWDALLGEHDLMTKEQFDAIRNGQKYIVEHDRAMTDAILEELRKPKPAFSKADLKNAIVEALRELVK